MVLKRRLISSNLTTRAVRSNEYDTTSRTNYYPWDNSKFIAEWGVLRNLEDLDLNKALFIRPDKQICNFEHMFGAIDENTSTERASFITAAQRIGSDLWYFFIVFLFPGCWFSCEATIFFSTMEVTSVFVNSPNLYMRSPSYFAALLQTVLLLLLLSLLFQGTCRGFSPPFWAWEPIKLLN